MSCHACPTSVATSAAEVADPSVVDMSHLVRDALGQVSIATNHTTAATKGRARTR
jgi:hypothetical protein